MNRMANITNREVVANFNYNQPCHKNEMQALQFIRSTIAFEFDLDMVKRRINLLERRARHLWKKSNRDKIKFEKTNTMWLNTAFQIDGSLINKQSQSPSKSCAERKKKHLTCLDQGKNDEELKR